MIAIKYGAKRIRTIQNRLAMVEAIERRPKSTKRILTTRLTSASSVLVFEGVLLVVGKDVNSFIEETDVERSEEHTSELQSLMRISYAVFCLKKKKNRIKVHNKL